MSRAFGAFRAATMGEQEDAQEFLAFFLDQLHEEVVEAKKKWPQLGGGGGGGGVAADGSCAQSGGAASGGGGLGAEGRQEEEEDWLEVGKGGAKAVVNAPDPRQKVSNSSVVRFVFQCVCLLDDVLVCTCHAGRSLVDSCVYHGACACVWAFGCGFACNVIHTAVPVGIYMPRACSARNMQTPLVELGAFVAHQ